MSDRELEKMRDSDFEAMLESSVAGLPPEDIVAKVTPWKKSVNRILIGIALTVIKLNFWYIDYIIPAIGTIMMLLGFRTLRHENKWFGICFAVSVIRTAYFFSSLILIPMCKP